MKGQVKTFFRPTPQGQAAFTDICREVLPGEFSGQRAWIIGGSAGWGKSLLSSWPQEGRRSLSPIAAANRMQTYCRRNSGSRSDGGLSPVERVGAVAGALSMAANRSKPLYLYYFATPFIFGAAKGRFRQSALPPSASIMSRGFCGPYNPL